MNTLILAEKPSVAMVLANVLGNVRRNDGYVTAGAEYIISWCYGHLLRSADAADYNPKYKDWRYEDLPIIPEKWQLRLTDSETGAQQFRILSELLNRDDVEKVICATDAGREGELIFRNVYNEARCKKPAYRLWVSSMEESALREGLKNVKPISNYDSLYKSAQSRERADWIVGINASRLFTTIYRKTLNVGRVQTPTLAMIAERDKQIDDFKSGKYWTVTLDGGSFTAESEKIDNMSQAQSLVDACKRETAAEVISSETIRHSQQPPKLYDLTTLQREANRMYGYTAEQTLNLTQSLYEKKLATYPRTDSRYITHDMAGTMKRMYTEACRFAELESKFDNVDKVINDSKVTDHHAIILTKNISDRADVSDDEKNIMMMIAQRMITAVSEKCVYDETVAIIRSAGADFKAKGVHTVSAGFTDAENEYKKRIGYTDEDRVKTQELPELSEGERIRAEYTVTEHRTSPPKRYTEDTILSAMENAGKSETDKDAEKSGLGTPATRAAILERLAAQGFIERKGRQIISTAKGRKLIAVLPDIIKSPGMTAEWENNLNRIVKGEMTSEAFDAGIESFVKSIVSTFTPESVSDEEKRRFTQRSEAEVIGKCPRCGKNVVAGKKSYYCENQKNCGFYMWIENKFFKDVLHKNFTKTAAKALLKSGKAQIKGATSKAGKKYDTVIVLNDNGKYVNFEFERFGK